MAWPDHPYPLPVMSRLCSAASLALVAAGVGCVVTAISGAGRLPARDVSSLALAGLILPHLAAAPLAIAGRRD
ncbi:MAG: hypothetical protein VW779_00660 [Halieaceae bacterium]